MTQTTQNKVGVLLANQTSPVFSWEYPAGNRIPLAILKSENFEIGALADMPWIEHLSGNYNYTALADSSGDQVLRHNLHSSRGGNDPISGKACSGLYTHTFRADQFHTAATHPEISLEQRFRFDDCLWDTNVNDPYPVIAGKLFICDKTVDSLAMYLGLTNNGTLTLICGNNASGVWSNDIAVGWVKETYGWRNLNATVRNNIVFTAPEHVFRSDGVWRTLRMEVRYLPDSLAFHKIRFKINGEILHDSLGINTDINGWLNAPPEFEVKGFRIYTADLDVNDALDVTTNPGTYAGHAAGYEVSQYVLYEGIQQ